MSRQGTSQVRVRYAETDQMGMAWHGSYLAWLEVGRTDLLRAHGLTYLELEQQDVRLPVIESHVRYHRPARYDDLLDIVTRVDELGRARVRFAYEVRRAGDGTPLATASTSHCAVRADGRPRRFPTALRALLAGGAE